MNSIRNIIPETLHNTQPQTLFFRIGESEGRSEPVL